MVETKIILDACCGSRMFWFDKHNPLVLFVDKRSEVVTAKDRDKIRTIEIKPDIIADFTNLPFEDNSFYLVVFDPPHLKTLGETSWMAKKYGKLPKDWQSLIHDGFTECMRVLKPNGTLVFKWNESEIRAAEVLSVIPFKPLTVPAHERLSHLNNERILVPEAKKLAYIADYEIDDNGEVVPSLRQLDYNGGMSEMPLYVNFKKVIIELM